MSEGTPIIIKKKKVHGGHAHHGGSWKVAYADFVTAMMAFFMVMWIMGLSDQTRAQIQGYFNDPLALGKSEPKSTTIVGPKSQMVQRSGNPQAPPANSKDAKQIHAIRDRLMHELASASKVPGLDKLVEVTVTDEGLRIELMDSRDAAFFKSGSAQLLPAAWPVIKQLAPIIADTHRKYIVEGHTDSVPYPSTSYDNWNLSQDRANSLRRALQQTGVSSINLVGIRALADTKLKFVNDPTNPKNRRVTILLPYGSEQLAALDLPKDDLINANTGEPNIGPPAAKH
jgi:chemotaxis protein MotB